MGAGFGLEVPIRMRKNNKEGKVVSSLRFHFNIHRSSIEIFALVFWITVSFLLPINSWQETPQLKLLALMIQKGLPVSLGILTAHSSRCFLFPYLDLSGMIKAHHWSGVLFLGSWYVGIILAWSWGG